MNIIVEKGDLFEVDKKYSLAHCISLDCAMGAGIAKEFNARYPKMKKVLLEIVSENNIVNPITIGYYPDDNNPVVYNLITKSRYWNKPTYLTLARALDDLVELCKRDNVTHLAMPTIGCGLDRLKWVEVYDLIINKFRNMDIEILVRYKERCI